MMTICLTVCDQDGKEAAVGGELDTIFEAQDFLDDISEVQGFPLLGDFFDAGPCGMSSADWAAVGLSEDDLPEWFDAPAEWFAPSEMLNAVRQLREYFRKRPKDFRSSAPADTLEGLLRDFADLEQGLNAAAAQNRQVHLRLILK